MLFNMKFLWFESPERAFGLVGGLVDEVLTTRLLSSCLLLFFAASCSAASLIIRYQPRHHARQGTQSIHAFLHNIQLRQNREQQNSTSSAPNGTLGSVARVLRVSDEDFFFSCFFLVALHRWMDASLSISKHQKVSCVVLLPVFELHKGIVVKRY